MATVTETLRLPGSNTPDSISVEVFLAGAGGARTDGYHASTDVWIVDRYLPTVTDGVWTMVLQANSEISPAGTVWRRIVRARDRIVSDETATVPTGSATHQWQDILADAPASIASSALSDHLTDTSDAHDASAISFSATGNVVATDVQAAIAELDTDLTAHQDDATAAHAASAISFSPTGTVAATDVQAAIAEVASEASGQPTLPYATTRYYTAVGVQGSTAFSVNVLTFMPFIVTKTHTFDRIGVNCTTAAAGSLVRIGIYSDSAGLPGALLLEAGTVDTTTTGAKDITISQELTAGRVWLAAVPQGGAPTLWSVGPNVTHLPGKGADNWAGLGNSFPGYNQNSVTGALPASATISGQGVPVLVAVRAS